MERLLYAISFLIITALIACTGSPNTGVAAGTDFLPPDTSSDTMRTADYYYMQLPGDLSRDQPRSIYRFNFVSLLETTVDLDIKIYNVVGCSDTAGKLKTKIALQPRFDNLTLRKMR